MKTLREHVENWYELSLEEVLRTIRKKGYITYMQIHDVLQKDFSEFEGYYTRTWEIDPFSMEFVDKVFDEFYKKIRKLPNMKVIVLSEKEVDREEKEIYGFNVDRMKTEYLSYLKNRSDESR